MNRRDQWACFCFCCYVFAGIAAVGVVGKVVIQRIEAAHAREIARHSSGAYTASPRP